MHEKIVASNANGFAHRKKIIIWNNTLAWNTPQKLWLKLLLTHFSTSSNHASNLFIGFWFAGLSQASKKASKAIKKLKLFAKSAKF